MDQALFVFLDDYTVWLDATKKEINNSKALLNETKQLIASNNNQISTSINSLRDKIVMLLQNAYILMECHIRVLKVYNMYSDEDKKTIDEYEPVSTEVYKLVKEINNFIRSYLNVNESNNNLDIGL